MKSGNDRWNNLIEQFKENRYKPHDIQRIVMLYEFTQENDRLLKEAMDRELELSDQDFLHCKNGIK